MLFAAPASRGAATVDAIYFKDFVQADCPTSRTWMLDGAMETHAIYCHRSLNAFYNQIIVEW